MHEIWQRLTTHIVISETKLCKDIVEFLLPLFTSRPPCDVTAMASLPIAPVRHSYVSNSLKTLSKCI